jgi:hypothetical protein
VLLAALAAALVVRRHRDPGYETGAVRGLGTGVLGGLLVALAVQKAGGSVGPGRMAHGGAPFREVLVAATVALGIGGLLGGVLATWWLRRGGAPDADAADTEDTVRL